MGLMAYTYVETAKFAKKALSKVLTFACVLSFSVFLLISNSGSLATLNSGSLSSKSASNLPSDSYKVRTNAVAVQTNGQTLTGNGVVIGIYDGGINLDNPAFISNGQSRIVSQACVGESTEINACETNPAKYANNVCFTTEVGCFHGMAVAGFAAGNESVVNINSRNVDVSGIATSAKISYIRQAMSKKGEIRYGDFVQALNSFVEAVRAKSPQAPDVINLSLSFPRSGYPNCEANNEVKRAIDYLTSQGVVVVAASGNNGDKTQVSYPACMKDVVAVGSSGINASSGSEVVSEFSNMSNEIDIVAPGENQVGLMPEVDRFVTVSGTSFAAPIVTGAIALLKEANPSISTAEVLELFASSSDIINDPKTGASFPNLNVQKLFGPQFDNLASKRQINSVDTNNSGVDSATDSLFGSEQSSETGINAGERALVPSIFSSPVDLGFIRVLNFYAIAAIVLAFLVLAIYIIGTALVRKSKKQYVDIRPQVSLSGYYLNSQVIDLTQDEHRQSPDDNVLV